MNLEFKKEPVEDPDYAIALAEAELKVDVKNESDDIINVTEESSQTDKRHAERSKKGEINRDRKNGSIPHSRKLTQAAPCSDPRECPKCQEIFQQESKYAEHVLTHAPWYTMYVCGVCGLTLEQKNALADHIVSHITSSVGRQYCDTYSNNSNRNDRYSDSDSDNEVLSLKVVNKKGNYTCNQCPAVFSKRHYLIDHKKCHDNRRRLEANELPAKIDEIIIEKRNVSNTRLYFDDTESDFSPPSLEVDEDYKASDSGEDDDVDENVPISKLARPEKRKMKIRNKSLVKRVKNPFSKEKEVKCEFCDEVFRLKAALRSHEIECHKEERLQRTRVVKCEVCGLLCARASYKGHMRIHTGERPYQCTLCDKAFANPGSLSQHKKVHSEKSFTCQICNKSYSRKAHLKMHMWVHSGQRSYVCSTCGKTFAKSCTLKVHMRLHTGEKPHVCNVCGKAFSQRYDLVTHAVVHTGEKPFVCDKCGKAFARRICLKTHILKLHAETVTNPDGSTNAPAKTHVCSTCGKAFFTRAELHQHSVVHSGVKPFECSMCGKTFARKSRVDLHMRVHTGEKPHVCETCGKSFSSRPQLRTHWVVHTGEKPHVCSTCGKAFALKDRLRDHLQLHTGEKPFVCIICGKAFALAAYLHSHMKIHKGDKPHVCETCDRAFYYKSELRKHCQSMHS